MNKLETLSKIISNPNCIIILKTINKHKQQTAYDLFKNDLTINYKNVHRSFKQLEDIECIKRVNIEYGKHGAIPYQLTKKGKDMLKIIESLEG